MALKVLDRFIYQLLDIGGGQNDAVDPHKIRPDEFTYLKDYLYDVVANLVMRSGCTPLNGDSGSNPITRFGLFTQKAGTKDLVVSTGEYISRLTGGSLSVLKSGLTPNQIFSFEVFNDMCFGVNGIDPNLVIMSDYSVRSAGCPAPAVKPTVALNGVGVLNGNYYYSYSWLYPWGESSESPASDLISPSSQKVLVTLGEAYPTLATGARFYRTIAGGTQRLLLYEIAKPTTNYDDNLGDGVLGVNAPVDQNIPPVSYLNLLYKNYMLYVPTAYPYRVDYSKLAEPDIVEVESFFEVLPDNGQRITGLYFTINPDLLVVFKQRSIAAYQGTSPYPSDEDPLVLRRINENIGCISPYSISRAGGDIIFLASDRRLYILSRVLLSSSETLEPIPISDRIEETMMNGLNPDMLPYAFGIYHNRRYILYVASRNSSELDTMLIWENKLGKKPWVTAQPVKGASLGKWFDASDQEIIVTGGSTSPRICQLFSGNDDNGVSINPSLKSRIIDIGQPFNNKSWKVLRILAEGSEDYFFRAKVYVIKDGVTSMPINEAVSGYESAPGSPVLWGQGTWGVGNWGSNVGFTNLVKNIKREIYINTNGEAMQFEITNLSATAGFKIKGFEIEGILLRTH